MQRFNLVFVVALIALFTACQPKTSETKAGTADTAPSGDSITIASADVLAEGLLTREEQAKLTPKEVLERLKRGNADFVVDNLTIRNNTERVRKASLGQFPKAVILSCLDSRVPVEDVFHSGLGNLFVARVAGNIVNEDILGSIEFGCHVMGSKLVLVLGHQSCGAIVSAIDNVKLGNITALLSKIQPSVATTKANFKGDTLSSNPAFVEAVCDQNVKDAVNEIRQKSPILKDMETKGQIMIIGAVYDMNTGKVTFFE